MDNQMKPGDVVQLKSGGVWMTITRIDGTVATCAYWDDKNNIIVPPKIEVVALNKKS